MARAKVNGNKGKKEENPCYYNHCHHNRDKKSKPWKRTGKGNKE